MPELPEHLRPIRRLQGGDKPVWLVEDLESGDNLVTCGVSQRKTARVLLASSVVGRGARSEAIAPMQLVERGDAAWWVGEYFPDGDLAAYLAGLSRPTLPIEDALNIGIRVAKALSSVHEAGFVHGDLKPANLLIDANGDVFLCDFDLAVEIGTEVPRGRGTPAYTAPEQWQGGEALPSSDLYGLGCLLYELIDGYPAFRAEVPEEWIRQHAHAVPDPLALGRDAVPEVLRRLVATLLAKDPSDRPACADHVLLSLQGIAALLLERRPIASPLVGRVSVVRMLEECIAETAGGGAATVEISGGAGFGKSLLLTELERRSELAAQITLRSSAEESLQSPYGVLVALLRPMAAWLGQLDPHDASVLRELFDRTTRRDPSDRHAAADAPGDEVLRIAASAMRRWARDQQIVLVVDDLQWVDPDSRSVVEAIRSAIAGGTAGFSGLLLATAERSGESDSATLPLPDAKLELEPGLHRVELRSFDEDDIDALVVARGFKSPTGQLVGAILSQSEGNPLFASVLVDHLASQKLMRESNGHTVLEGVTGAIALPKSITALTRRAMASASKEVVSDLEWGACLGFSFRSDHVAQVSGKSEGLEDRLLEARRAGVLAFAGTECRFRHGLVWRCIYDGIDPYRRRRLHREIASHWIELAREDVPERAARVVYHLLYAGSEASSEELVHWTREAGEVAYARYAWRQAGDLFDRAVRHLEAADDVRPALLAELRHRAGLSHHFCFDAQPAIAHLQAATDFYREGDDSVAYAIALHDLVLACGQSGRVEYGTVGTYVEELKEASRRLGPENRRLQGRVMHALAAAHWVAQRPAEATGFASQAIEMAREIGDGRLAGETHFQLGIARVQELAFDDALSSLRASLACGERDNDPYVTRLALSRIPVVLYTTGHLGEAQSTLDRAIAVNEVVQQPGDVALAGALSTLLKGVAGDSQGAIETATKAIEAERRVRSPWPALILHPAAAYAHVQARDFPGALRVLEDLPGVFDGQFEHIEEFSRQLISLVHYYAGDRLESRGGISSRLVDPEGAIDLPDLLNAALHIELADASGVVVDGRAESVLARAEARGALLTTSWPFSIALSRGMASRVGGRTAEAIEHFDRAVTLLERIGARPLAARARYERARATIQLRTRLASWKALDDLKIALPVLVSGGPRVIEERAQRLCEHVAERVGGEHGIG